MAAAIQQPSTSVASSASYQITPASDAVLARMQERARARKPRNPIWLARGIAWKPEKTVTAKKKKLQTISEPQGLFQDTGQFDPPTDMIPSYAKQSKVKRGKITKPKLETALRKAKRITQKYSKLKTNLKTVGKKQLPARKKSRKVSFVPPPAVAGPSNAVAGPSNAAAVIAPRVQPAPRAKILKVTVPTDIPDITSCPPSKGKKRKPIEKPAVKYWGKRPNKYSAAGRKIAAQEKKAAKKPASIAKKRSFPKENPNIPTLAKVTRTPKTRKMTAGEKRKRTSRDEGKGSEKYVRTNTW